MTMYIFSMQYGQPYHMKMTIEIADDLFDLFEHSKRVARKEKTTFRSLVERVLQRLLKDRPWLGTSLSCRS
jgi:hypothetical protein